MVALAAASAAIATLLGLASSPGVIALDVVDYTPISIPLAVRGPYFSTWLIGPEEELNLAHTSPSFWTTLPLGWTGLLRVDGKTWNWMGNVTDWESTTQATAESTSFSTNFVMTNDPPTVALNATFISPMTPRDLFRQALPFSYLELTVTSLDGKDHDVQVYTDVNGLWLANDEAELLEWDVQDTNYWSSMRVRLQNQRLFSEEELPGPFDKDRILHGDLYYTAESGQGAVETSFAAGDDAVVTRRLFAEHGRLYGSLNDTYRSTRTRSNEDSSTILDEPVFAFAHSFGTVSGSTSAQDSSVLLSIGHVRDPIVQMKKDDGGLKPMRPLWAAVFDDVPGMIDFVMSDFDHVYEVSEAFNQQLFADARRIESDEYARTVALSARQVWGAMEGAWDEDLDVANATLTTVSPLNSSQIISTLYLLKEVSSNGNCQTVDVIAPFLPFALYAAPELLPMLLEPHYRYSATPLWTPKSPPHDLGDHYPNFTAHDNYPYNGPLPIEEAGNMLGMAWSAVLRSKTGEKSLKPARQQVEQYYNLLKQWSDYLVEEALFPQEQSSTDDFEGPTSNQTSLTVKGIMGIRAFSELAKELGNEEDAKHHLSEANKMMDKFLKLAVSEDGSHMLSHYGNDSSWHSQYNLYFDKLFNTSQFPQWVYDMQDKFYPTVAEQFGVPLDSSFAHRAKIDWFAWLSATAGTPSVRSMFADFISRYFRQTRNLWFGDLINTAEGWSVGFQLRPVVGGHFALLGLDLVERIRNGTFVVSDEPSEPLQAGLNPFLSEKVPAMWQTVKEQVSDHSDALPWVVALLTFCAIGLWWVQFSQRHKRGVNLDEYEHVALDETPTSSPESARTSSPFMSNEKDEESNHFVVECLDESDRDSRSSSEGEPKDGLLDTPTPKARTEMRSRGL
ncbi:hypothetical protein OIO90_004228 [Microbotryomycetes sp. JL221]|nr:hypothetical protein OIO90_004228 [Microbotryomycetes sp. JL221]